MSHVIEQELAIVKEEKLSQAATSSPQAEPHPKAKEQRQEDKASITRWNQEQLQLLVKGVNLYPPGTTDRWNTIANYINTHIHTDKKTGTMVVAMVKKLQKLGG